VKRRRLDWIERDGRFGDTKLIEGGDSELRIDLGPGHRVHYGQDGEALVLLLIRGDKSTPARGKGKAIDYWQDYVKRRPR
jgi:putative addiction module killer protein